MKNGNSYKGSAVVAGLRYVSDAAPGIRRQRAGTGFVYKNGHGAIRDKAVIGRIRALAIPPAWEQVWICPREDGHLQATGRDARGRKQYRYHPHWREVRDETKYGRMAAFARALPRIRRRVREDLAREGLPREKVLATIVRLLEATRMRVGNEEYARENDSFGLTTLRARQVRVRGATMQFRFRGKSGVWHRFALEDRKLAAIVRRMRDLPGYELFQYVDESGETRSVDSTDVNEYLKGIAGEEFTSKDFRTWAGTVLAARALYRAGYPAEKRKLALAIDEVARALGNTAAVCRKCYIHPAVIDAYATGTLARMKDQRKVESCVRRLLERQKDRPHDENRRFRAPLRALGRVPRRRPRLADPRWPGANAAHRAGRARLAAL